ncbi:glutamyl-tRNA reductase [Nitrosophilus alvini]|uniref:glutamyl-tRNA reductase n=1 Tax=Nitrosophilus alvini TaxID=2714855 RepID=UPI00190C9A56|nr:glutamyl-tRNA reductase [Nitrosophilus alvini]
MQYLVISFSHKNSDVTVREKLALSEPEIREKTYKKLMEHRAINEVIILSTCNRVEVIASVKDPYKATEYILSLLSSNSGISLEELEGRADIYEDNGAIHHIFSVASALDSLVIGETQISGQLKDAYKESFEKGYCSQKLSRVMHYAFKCAAAVRNSTDISKNPVSVASAAVAKAKSILGSLGGYTALILGTGEMGLLAAKHLISNGCNIILIGRDLKKTKEIVKELGSQAQAEPFSNIKDLLNRYRLLFTATGAPHPIITPDMIEPREFERHWFDMAVPRDIEECSCKNVNIYSVDDLQDIVNQNLALREEQASIAYKIVGRFTMEFFKWLQSLSVDPIIKEIRNRAREASLKELKKAIKKGYLPAEYEEEVTKILHNAFNTFLHRPTVNLKKVAEEPSGDTIVESIKYFFDINGGKETSLNRYKCEYHMDVRSEA